MQEKPIIKIALYLILLFLFALGILTMYFVGKYINDDIDLCLDTSYCAEGLKLNIEGRKIIINEKTCAQYNGFWTKEKYCRFK